DEHRAVGGAAGGAGRGLGQPERRGARCLRRRRPRRGAQGLHGPLSRPHHALAERVPRGGGHRRRPPQRLAGAALRAGGPGIHPARVDQHPLPRVALREDLRLITHNVLLRCL
ncbi:Protein of unknown function, partial [Gryllus bimaculatus]